MKTRMKRDQGSIAALAFAAMVPLTLAIAGFSVDCMHVADERVALQRATDAGALAGGYDISNWRGNLAQSATTGSGTNYSTGKIGTNEEPIDMALAATALNVVDGRRPVTNGSTITVFAEMLTNYQPNNQQATNDQPPIACHVHAQMTIRSLFAGFLGNWQQTVSSDSIAAANLPITTLYKYLPILISAPQGDENGSDMQHSWEGENYSLDLNAPGAVLQPGHGGHGNSVWIFGSDAANLAAINAIAQGGSPNPAEPAIAVDSSIPSQTTSFNSPSALAALNNLPVGTMVIVPVTSDYLTVPDPTTGALPTAGPHPIIGFIPMRINKWNSSGSFWANFSKTIGSGNGALPLDPTYKTYGLMPTDQAFTVSLVK